MFKHIFKRARFPKLVFERLIGVFDGAKLFAKATGCPVALINDGAAAAIAEMRFGAGRRFMGKTLLLTLGTGIGTALAYRGVVVPMEFGHLPHKGESWERFAAASAREREDLSWKEWGKRLSIYIAELEALFWPELIIIGGGVSAKHEKYFEFLNPRAKLVPAEFLNQAGIAGAAIWVRWDHNKRGRYFWEPAPSVDVAPAVPEPATPAPVEPKK